MIYSQLLRRYKLQEISRKFIDKPPKTYLYIAPLNIAKSIEEVSNLAYKFRVAHLLQWSVASEGIGVDEEVVRRELAPFSSSIRIFLAQKGRNLLSVFTGSAFATHSTS